MASGSRAVHNNESDATANAMSDDDMFHMGEAGCRGRGRSKRAGAEPKTDDAGHPLQRAA